MTAATRGAAQIAAAFDAADQQGRAALIAYLTGTFPDANVSRACFAAAVEAGADVLEVGIPFSDPMMDGPIIQSANQRVLNAGVRVADQLELIASLDVDVPIVVMTYVTIADTRGYTRFAEECAQAGVDGVILPDLPVEEADAWRAAAQGAGLATIFLASSVSTDERLASIGAASSGWVYATGLLGVTGVQRVAGDVTRDLVARVRTHTDLPVAVGIGVKDRASAAEVAGYADGVIVGSAIVDAIAQGLPDSAPERVRTLVRELRAGVENSVRT
ncbi:MAG: tryptophan synthase subunit alpha [Nitriliruptoraceae bacterium]